MAEPPAPDDQADSIEGNDLRQTVGGLTAITGLQTEFYAGNIPREAAIANVSLLFGFTDAESASLFPEIAPQKLTPVDSEPTKESIQFRETNSDSASIRKARNIVLRALAAGKIKKPKTCEKCGAKGKLEADHSNYKKPLDVTWLCPSCHHKRTNAREAKESTVRLLSLARAYWQEQVNASNS